MINSRMVNNSDIIFNNTVDLGNPKHYCADIKLSKSIGWVPQVNFKQGLAEYLDWFLEEKND
jgi:UDP-glucose 4-epimerase